MLYQELMGYIAQCNGFIRMNIPPNLQTSNMMLRSKAKINRVSAPIEPKSELMKGF